MAFKWAQQYPDIQLLCQVFGLYELDEPLRHNYIFLKGLIQEGPQCGLVALAMATGNPSKDQVSEIFNCAKAEGYTNNGEMFSVNCMAMMAGRYLKNRIEIFSGSLNCKDIVEFLLGNGMILVPYDCDFNHTPITRNGHKAHWAIISGVVETETDVYVLAKHGKSLNTAIWNLRDLAKSNEQLVEFSPDRKNSELEYVVPQGGLTGPLGLCSKAVLIYPQECNGI